MFFMQNVVWLCM